VGAIRRGDMKRVKKEKWPKHKMGKFYGYEENEDGSIIIAPGLADIMEKAIENEEAIRAAADIFNRLTVDLLKGVNQRKKEFWEKIFDEYGLERNPNYTYIHATRTVKLKEAEAK
jgi:hypothetical protein